MAEFDSVEIFRTDCDSEDDLENDLEVEDYVEEYFLFEDLEVGLELIFVFVTNGFIWPMLKLLIIFDIL